MESKTKNIVLVCLGLVLILLIGLLVMFFMKNSKKEDEINITTTTITTTTTQKTDLVLENSGVELTIENSELENDSKLHVEKVDVVLKDVKALAVYDITLKDSEGNVIKVNDTNIKISIPYENKDNYTKFKVLYLNENNEILKTYNANYVNGKVVFNVNHLSRYAIVGEKEEVDTTTTSKKTTKKTTTKSTTTKTTTKATTTKTTAKATTKATTTKTTTTTTKKVTYSYEWSKEGDQAGKYYLYVVDNSGNKVAGTVTLTSKATGSSKTFDIPASGRLFVKDNYTVSNAKGN